MQPLRVDELKQNPRETTNKLSVFLFCFTIPTFIKGFKKTLDENDLYRTLKEHRSERLGDRFGIAWKKEVETKLAKKERPNLFRTVFRVFGLNFMLLGVYTLLVEILIRGTQPLLLGALVAYYSNTNHVQESDVAPYLYAAGVVLWSALNVLMYHPCMFGILHLSMKIRIALCSTIYRKALKLSPTALGDTTTGQVVNLISNDVGRLDTALIQVHYLWVGPIQTVFATYLMYREVGLSAVYGVIVMLAFIPIVMFLGRRVSTLRLRTALRTDTRVRMMNEIISGIQVIKMYAWEIPFSKMVGNARSNEMDSVRSVNYIRGILQSFFIFITRTSVFTSLVTYVLLGKFLTAEKAFTVTALYNTLRMAMTAFFPNAIGQLAELMVSLRRIEKYLLYEETSVAEPEPEPTKDKIIPTAIIKENGKPVLLNGDAHHNTGIMKNMADASIKLTNVKAKWDNNLTEYTLNDITLKIPAKSLVAVIGPVGSGKSSLMHTILGELTPLSGNVEVNGKLSYASQEPWLFTGSVRQNILFGLPMDKTRYKMVIKKCALERDLELFPYGDKTIVGERGASLSGGQKARISLARAVYRQADIYLLDDPLSAVDTHVGRHLFDQCMRSYLRENIVILVTHQLQFLEQADLIIIMDKGHVSAFGTYDSMRQSGLDFAQLLVGPEKTVEEEKLEVKRSISRQSSKQRSRTNSVSSLSSFAESLAGVEVPEQIQETRQVGDVGFTAYKKYFTSGGGYFLSFVSLFCCLAVQVIASGSDYFISYWSEENERVDSKTELTDIYIFAGLTAGLVVFTLARSILFFGLASRSSIVLHNKMFNGVIRASMYFFNTNPSGRILNRFSKDMGQVDEVLPAVIMDVIQIFLTLIGSIFLIALVNPWYLAVTAVLCVIFYYFRVVYLRTSMDVKRLEATTRSPIYSHLSATLNGLPTIRACGAQKMLIDELDNYQNLHSSAFYLFLSTNRAFGYYLDVCCVVYIGVITMAFFIFPASGSSVGLAITQAMGLTGMIQWGMRQSAELENNMTSVERLIEYETIEPEGEFDSKPDKKPAKTWPEQGKVAFDNLSLRYAPDPKSDTVLKSLKFVIQSMEKVGVVGRTGAGKSSLINALFRLSFNDGSIIIDNLDTKEIGLHDLRSKISIIPQEPVLFSGTMRYNLDPMEEHSDEELWRALEQVELKQAVSDLPIGLLSKISEGGSNFSVGQRQLVCLARAILRENKILVLDEATANVDPQTDALIQTAIRTKFKHCTVITIAHRLHTIMDSDKVLVMDAGQAVEFGAPYELLTQSEKKVFYGMVQQTGSATFDRLFEVASKAYEENLQVKKDS